MSDLPDVEATVKLVKEILSESLDLVSEKRRFRAFLQDYSRQAHVEKGLLLEGKHLKALVSGMGYPRFDEVASRNKTAARSVGLRGLGDWLARTEGYDGALCQWVEEVWSQSFGEASHRRAEEDRRRKADDQARRRNADEQAKRREEEARRRQAADNEKGGIVSPRPSTAKTFRPSEGEHRHGTGYRRRNLGAVARYANEAPNAPWARCFATL